MTIYGTRVPGAGSIANWATKVELLTEEGKKRLKVVDWHRKQGKNKSLTARHFGYNRDTIQDWVERFQKEGILGLNDKSRKPKKERTPTTSPDTVAAVVKVRRQYPAWSKYKLQALLKKESVFVSPSTIGRILKRRGLIDQKVSMRKRKSAFHPRARYPHGFKISHPGDMIQIDTKYIMLVGGRKLYQFTAIDVLSKMRVLAVYPSRSSRNGKKFLELCFQSFPFPVKAIQTDNGSEFLKEFHGFCETKKIPHYFIYPRHPKQNSYVESSHSADEREFYRQGNISSELGDMNQRIKTWERTWNTIRPHESLGQITPSEYLRKWQHSRLPTKDVISLQT
jgi:transposase InsO family protein